MQVHEKVYNYIRKNGIKQNVLAKKCNISVSTFNAMMRGHRKMYAEDFRAICYALEVSPEVFIEYSIEKGKIQGGQVNAPNSSRNQI